MFNPEIQFRCTIIRGKAKTDLDNLLPKYAKIIQEICPCSKDEFPRIFNEYLERIIGGTKKTLDNHRTEIAGKLFGMYYYDSDNTVYPSERTLRFLENEDQPAFFKDICVKFQFPNGMDSIHTIEEKISQNISIRQFPFVLELLNIAKENNTKITKDEIAYFVLNSLEVLQSIVPPIQVYEKIIEYRNLGKIVKVKDDGKASSYSMQHINEQLNLLELANLIRTDHKVIYLNPYEKVAIDYIRSFHDKKPNFDVYQYSFSSIEDRKRLLHDWQVYFSSVDKGGIELFSTSINAIQFNIEEKAPKISDFDKIALGDDGESFVFTYEKEKVEKYDKRLTNKVLLLGKTKGLGYDIQSIFADGSEKSEFVHYIEVKSTKRVTVPNEGIDGWIDAITLTRNEWIAAEQHSNSFSIYRVYFTPEKIIVYVIRNPYLKNQERLVKCTPINYRLDFSLKSIDLTFEKV